jgi:hypothetical protein
MEAQRDRLLRALKSVQAERVNLAQQLHDLTRRAEANAEKATQLPGALGRIADVTAENERLAQANKDLMDRLTQCEVFLKRHNERILKPLEAARLVVKIRSVVPLDEELDLDLYVQDPRDEVCFWLSPRILNAAGEQATLIPSEDLREVQGLIDAGTRPVAEEVYYAAEPLLEGGQAPYLVFCMLRKIGATARGAIQQTVEWEVILKDNRNAECDRYVGEFLVSETGAVTNCELGRRYPGLVPLTGFEIVRDATPEIRPLERDQVPDLLRGWFRAARGQSPMALTKLRDRERDLWSGGQLGPVPVGKTGQLEVGQTNENSSL